MDLLRVFNIHISYYTYLHFNTKTFVIETNTKKSNCNEKVSYLLQVGKLPSKSSQILLKSMLSFRNILGKRLKGVETVEVTFSCSMILR